MKLPDAVIDKLQDGKSPVTHAAIIEGVDMIIRYPFIEAGGELQHTRGGQT